MAFSDFANIDRIICHRDLRAVNHPLTCQLVARMSPGPRVAAVLIALDDRRRHVARGADANVIARQYAVAVALGMGG
jgi:hypothetical protein